MKIKIKFGWVTVAALVEALGPPLGPVWEGAGPAIAAWRQPPRALDGN